MHGCCCKEYTPRKTATLTFRRYELLYDIGNYCWVEGDIMEVEDEHDRHPVIDVLDEGNVDRVTRVLDLTFRQCVELCYPYSKTAVIDNTSLDDVLGETDIYTMTLSLPEDFSQTSVELLENYIHELMVYRVLADWLSITKPDAADNWKAKIEEMKNGIVRTLTFRRKTLTRKMSPF